MKPVIAVTATRSAAAWVAKHVQPYLDAVASAGGEPFLVVPDKHHPTGPDLQSLACGLLLSGGGDIHPDRYSQPVAGTEMESIDEQRDRLELTLAAAALSVDMPVLAICRGLQVLNVALGGGLLQHIEGHRSPSTTIPRPPLFHTVHLQPATLLAGLLGHHESTQVNSYHHQVVDDTCLSQQLRVSARSHLNDDGFVEAMESPTHGWVLGVQWHPERITEVPLTHQHLFSHFVDAASMWAARRRAASSSAQ